MVIYTTERIPIRQWRIPRRSALERGIFPSGRPPFYPFPTVSDLLAAAYCPNAIFHRMLHGIDSDVFTEQNQGRNTGRGMGERFHEFIANLKTAIAEGEVSRPRSVSDLMHSFRNFARGWTGFDDLWRFYLQPWATRKIQEIQQINANTRTFFETTATNLQVHFDLEGEHYEYPLLGNIDELDIDGQRIIERTTRGRPDDVTPPGFKAYQVWLLCRILSSIERSRRPEELREVDFGQFRLIVETPFNDFEVDKTNPEFERRSLDGYTWIHDLALDWRSEFDARANSACNNSETNWDCGFSFNCFGRVWPYPESRPRMRRSIREFFRPLLWDIMWTRDLLEYQLLVLNADSLRELGILFVGRVQQISRRTREVEVVASEDETGYVSVLSRHAGVAKYTIIFGTPFIGQRVEASFSRTDGGRLVMRVSERRVPISQNALILSGDSGAFFESKPWFLNRQTQSGLFRFQAIGRERQERAAADSLIQMLESLFGGRALRRNGNEQ
jgi:hypothetical protein